MTQYEMFMSYILILQQSLSQALEENIILKMYCKISLANVFPNNGKNNYSERSAVIENKFHHLSAVRFL